MVGMSMSMSMSMEKLPQEITLDILSRLPAECVLDCKQVCKSWLTILDHHPCFPQIHLSRRLSLQLHQQQLHDTPITGVEVGFIFSDDRELWYKKYDENDQQSFKTLTRIFRPPVETRRLQIIGSCNGLVCLKNDGINDPVYICNPVTREYSVLPKLDSSAVEVVMGFGYHPMTNEYKVVRIYYQIDEDEEEAVGHAQVYTLGSGTGWRDVGEMGYSLREDYGVLANGEIHWEALERKIVAFNLVNEEFRYFDSPPVGNDNDNWLLYDDHLWALGGSLSLFHRVTDSATGEFLFGLSRVDVWLLTKTKNSSTSYDMIDQEKQTWSWSKEFTLPITYKINPLGLTKKGEIFSWQNKGFLSRYDRKTAILEKLVDDDFDLDYIEVVPHVNSFVSLKALGENGRVEE